ncbi:MAG: DUF5615 family PIN-like protein [Candidatus Bipolaricaulia bacterium]
MRLLLDESLPRRLSDEFSSHEVRTVPEMGWAGKQNGELLALASDDFDVFITADQNLEHQQNLSNVDLAIVVLVAPTNRLGDLQPLVPQAIDVLNSIQPTDLVYLRQEP